MPVYRELQFDDDNLAELERHHIDVEDVLAVLSGGRASFEIEGDGLERGNDRP